MKELYFTTSDINLYYHKNKNNIIFDIENLKNGLTYNHFTPYEFDSVQEEIERLQKMKINYNLYIIPGEIKR